MNEYIPQALPTDDSMDTFEKDVEMAKGPSLAPSPSQISTEPEEEEPLKRDRHAVNPRYAELMAKMKKS